MRFLIIGITLILLTPVIALSQTAPKEENAKQVLLWNVPAKGKATLLPDISLIGSLAAGWMRFDPATDQGENPNRTGFNLQGMELALQSVVDPYVRGDVFILFHEHDVEIEEATLTTLALPANLQFRAGKLLAKFGRENARHLEQLSFIDASLTNRHFFGPEGFHELGAELSYLFPFPWSSELAVQFLQGENPDNFDGSRKGDFAYLGNWKNTVDLTSNLTMQVGLSGAFGTNNSGLGNSTQIYGGDLYFRWRPNDRRGLKWQTESFFRRRELAAATPWDGGITSQLVYQFAKRWETGVRYDQIGLPMDTVRQWQVSPVLTFLASEFFRIRTQYNVTRATATATQHEAFLQLQFNMGPHGAHAF